MSGAMTNNGLNQSTRFAIVAVVVTLTGAICLSVYRFGARAQSELDRQIARQIEEENIAFCRRFGAGSDVTAIAACSAQLTDIRLRHERRLQARYQGLL